MKRDHMQALKTLYDTGQISRQAMKSIRGQILGMRTDKQREDYLKVIIKRSNNKSVIPQQFYPIFKAIAQIEEGKK